MTGWHIVAGFRTWLESGQAASPFGRGVLTALGATIDVAGRRASRLSRQLLAWVILALVFSVGAKAQEVLLQIDISDPNAVRVVSTTGKSAITLPDTIWPQNAYEDGYFLKDLLIGNPVIGDVTPASNNLTAQSSVGLLLDAA